MNKGGGAAAIWPTVSRVNEVSSYRLSYTVGERIPKGGGIFIWPAWGGSDVQVDRPDGDGYVTCRTEAKARLRATIREKGHWYYSTTEGDRQIRMFVAIFLEVVNGELRPGDVVEVALKRMRSQYTYELEKQWVVKALPDGKGMPLWEKDGLRVSYLPGEPARVRLYAPSVVGRGEAFSLAIGVFDRFDNPVMEPFGKKVTLSASPSVEGLPECVDFSSEPWNHVKLRGLRCREAGFCYVRANGGEIGGESNPICVKDGPADPRIFWGDLHVHTNLSDGVGPPEEAYQMARDMYALDFAAICDHETAGEDWERTKRAARVFNSPGRFVTIPAWEWTSHRHGHRNVYFLNEEESVPCIGHGEGVTLEGLYGALRKCGGPAMVIPHHPIWFMDFSRHDPDFERVLEIYSIWGSSEFEDNELRFLAEKQPNQALGLETVRDALARGYRVGFVASSDCHLTRAGQQFPEDKRMKPITPETSKFEVVFGPGLTGARAPELTREAVWESLHSRNCYATTGVRMYMDFSVNGARMGSEVDGSGQVQISLEAAGTARIVRAEVIRNGEVVYSAAPNDRVVRLALSDRGGGEAYYYGKVIQEDKNMGWTSPVWVGR